MLLKWRLIIVSDFSVDVFPNFLRVEHANLSTLEVDESNFLQMTIYVIQLFNLPTKVGMHPELLKLLVQVVERRTLFQ